MPTSKTPKKSTAKKSTAREVLVQVQTRGDKTLTAEVQARLDALEERDNQREAVVRAWMEELLKVAHKLKAAKVAYRQALREVLDEIYTKYIEIEYSDMRSEFYNELRINLLDAGYRVQANTPDAGLLIRLVWGSAGLSNASISQYAAVFENARNNDIAAGALVDWLKEKHTLAEAAKKIRNNYDDIRKERLKRARIFIIKYLEWRETRPYAKLKMFAENANNYVNVDTHLVVMLGTAVRRFDRESDYADIHISHIMPPNFDIEIKIIDKWARYIEPKLEIYEAKAEQLSTEQWAFELEDKLWEHDVLEAERYVQRTQMRNFAKRFDNEHEFEEHARAFLESRGGFAEKKPKKPRKAVKKKP